ncbi:hypothetical protein [Uliginosibacterium gangwonense]|uniref:hypothetical protein n=1 Tax=Uliginosibacterium gangwonense TaxID=392736 RepID=UPI00036C492E|nr:hypothetical protein [Uliginosibacterium gangwonense]
MNIKQFPFFNFQIKPISIALNLLLISSICLFVYVVCKTSAPQPENTAPAAAQSQADGSQILARTPKQEALPPAPHVIPKGAVEERRISVTVKPRPASLHPYPKTAATPPADQSSPPAQAQTDCAPVTVDLSLIRQNGGRRVIASSPDGIVIGGLDIPIESALLPAAHPWAAGLSVGHDKSPGVWLERDLGRIRLGAEALRERAGDLQARVRVGWSW